MKINATLHCHGAWTDYAHGKFDIELFPRCVEKLADVAIAKGLDLVGLTDISGKHVCEIYRPLVDQRGDRYIIEQDETSTVLTRKEDEKKVVFARTLEVLSNDAHVLIVGTAAIILGARPLEAVIDETYSVGGKAIADHPCYTIKLGKGMGEQKVRKFRKEGKLLALEENANIAKVMEFIGHYNERAIALAQELDMPIIANCDGNTARDMGRMYTTYFVKENTKPTGLYNVIIDLLAKGNFEDSLLIRRGEPKRFISLPLHVVRGIYSIVRAKKGWIEKSLPAC